MTKFEPTDAATAQRFYGAAFRIRGLQEFQIRGLQEEIDARRPKAVAG